MSEQDEWTNVNYIMEIVRNEGDASCERAFDFLLDRVKDRDEVMRSNLMWFQEAKKAWAEVNRLGGMIPG